MYLTTVVLGCLVFGQASVGVSTSAETPAGMVAEATTTMADGELQGQPLNLLAALSTATDRRRQLDVAHAYWRLVGAVAAYHSVLDCDHRLSQLQAGITESAQLRTARAASVAKLDEALVTAIVAQHELASLVSLPPDAALPLPADQPHVGKYLTGLDQLSSLGIAPARARLADRTLPIRLRVIEGRVLAVGAARDARSAAVDAHELGQVGLSSVLASMEECLRQRLALMASVCRYNDDIADYALAVAAPGIDVRTLVAMLIKSPRDSSVRAAGHFQPVPTPAQRPGTRVPTPAVRPQATEKSVPTHAVRPYEAEEKLPTPSKQWSQAEPWGETVPSGETVPVGETAPAILPPNDGDEVPVPNE